MEQFKKDWNEFVMAFKTMWILWPKMQRFMEQEGHKVQMENSLTQKIVTTVNWKSPFYVMMKGLLNMMSRLGGPDEFVLNINKKERDDDV